jgi:release factor glutamine methyltransferase
MPEMAQTLDALRRAGRAQLAAAGIAEPAREARRITDALGERPDRLEYAFVRRAAGEPLAYVLGRAGFRHLDLIVDSRVLIPRPETEGLVERLLARVSTGAVADVGTGSGCIALSLAQEGRFARVTAIDASRDALEIAAANVLATGLPVTLIRADLLEAAGGETLDAIISNPPYLSDGEYAVLDSSVRDWEPAAALASGDGGLDATLRLLRDGCRVLRPGGWLALEVDCTRAAAVGVHAAALGWNDVTVESDLYGRERYLLARRSATS